MRTYAFIIFAVFRDALNASPEKWRHFNDSKAGCKDIDERVECSLR